ncbi:MAG: type II secretion system protein [Candidatus Pacebacteria bacterium]|nr:type II secretion system protein [Candidatus Paceibacterota bacterium]
MPKGRSVSPGFTLIEFLIVTAVFGIIFSISLVNYQKINRRQVFRQTLNDVLEDLRLAQDKAISGEKPPGCSEDGRRLDGYEFFFEDNRYAYQIKAICEDIDYGAIKYGSLKGETYKTDGPDSIIFRILGRGVDLGGFFADSGWVDYQTRSLDFVVYNSDLKSQIMISDSGEIYLSSDPCIPYDQDCSGGQVCCLPNSCQSVGGSRLCRL